METTLVFEELLSIKLILWLKEYFITIIGIILAIWIIQPLASILIIVSIWIVYFLLFIPYLLACLFLIIMRFLPNSIIDKCSRTILFFERKILPGVRGTQNSLKEASKQIDTNVTKVHTVIKSIIKIAVTSFILITALAFIYDIFIMEYTTLDKLLLFLEG